MTLSKEALGQLNRKPSIEVPDKSLLELPEKVLQFGTGVLLRGLPDYFIDKANKKGVFNGRVVVVKSTESDSSAFDRQDGLYTICVRGVEHGKTVEENIINASISRVLSANTDWIRVLECAHKPEIKVVISNTTEVGIQLIQDDITAHPPVSFPGKLLAFLYERYRAFNGSLSSGLVIIPTELITDNGSKLEAIILELAFQNNLDQAFIKWIENANKFCNSLVDRIIPGKPAKAELDSLEQELGYKDELLTMSESFRLWAIEGDESIKSLLSFGSVDEGVIVAPDITLFKELKLRLLNGTHTFNCGLAFLSGFPITRDAVNDPIFSVFAKNLMHDEIAKSIPYEIDAQVKRDFANRVYERFCNPYIDHRWISITAQYTSKMKMRNIPLLMKHYEWQQTVPAHMALGFAGYLLFMKTTRKEGNRYYGMLNGSEYEITDDAAGYFYDAWSKFDPDELAATVMSNQEHWEEDLTRLPGFLAAVQKNMHSIIDQGALQTIAELGGMRISV